MLGNSLCETHEQARQQKHESLRPSASERGYGLSWKRIRDAYLVGHPLCAMCGKPGLHVDHILARAAGGSDDDSNLQTLCASHHSEKTAKYDGGFGNVAKVKAG